VRIGVTGTGLIRDMSESDPLLQAQAQLEAARRQLQLLTDTISHDMRAPLRAIEGFATRVADSANDRLEAREREQLQRIRAAAVRMNALLEGLGELSRATHAELEYERVDLTLLAEWILTDLQASEPNRDAELVIQPGLSVRGDEPLMRQLLLRLLDNAWKFAASRPTTRIEVSGRNESGRSVLVIRDNGIGFDPRYADKLFQPLQRLHSAEEGAGHGLGLAIAHCIATRHHGRITATSRPGDGATFIVDLPGV
jgi:signal transduction histidine kinase